MSDKKTSSSEQTTTAGRPKSKDSCHIKILSFILSNRVQSHLADKLGVQNSFLSNIRADRETLPVARKEAIVDMLNQKCRYTSLSLQDMDLPRDYFIHKFKNEHFYLTLCDEMGVNPTELNNSGKNQSFANYKIDRLVGRYVAIYLCQDPNGAGQNVAIEEINIDRSEYDNCGKVTIVIDDNAKDQPSGRLRVKDDTIEICIEYESAIYPSTCYLAPLPRGEEITIFLAIYIDITYKKHSIVARPVVFLKVPEAHALVPALKEAFGPETGVFKITKEIVRTHVKFNQDRYELNPGLEIADGYDVDLLEAILELNKSLLPEKKNLSTPAEAVSA